MYYGNTITIAFFEVLCTMEKHIVLGLFMSILMWQSFNTMIYINQSMELPLVPSLDFVLITFS